jgi:hypothetical protein
MYCSRVAAGTKRLSRCDQTPAQPHTQTGQARGFPLTEGQLAAIALQFETPLEVQPAQLGLVKTVSTHLATSILIFCISISKIWH